jgi:hypothetical protein
MLALDREKNPFAIVPRRETNLHTHSTKNKSIGAATNGKPNYIVPLTFYGVL